MTRRFVVGDGRSRCAGRAASGLDIVMLVMSRPARRAAYSDRNLS
jgi:hypothetical protein